MVATVDWICVYMSTGARAHTHKHDLLPPTQPNHITQGRIVYAGPASQASAFFASQGLVCPANFCPSDFFLDVRGFFGVCEMCVCVRVTVCRWVSLCVYMYAYICWGILARMCL